MYWMQSLPVFSVSTTTASMLRPSTFVMATWYLATLKQTRTQQHAVHLISPPVYRLTQCNDGPVLPREVICT